MTFPRPFKLCHGGSSRVSRLRHSAVTVTGTVTVHGGSPPPPGLLPGCPPSPGLLYIAKGVDHFPVPAPATGDLLLPQSLTTWQRFLGSSFTESSYSSVPLPAWQGITNDIRVPRHNLKAASFDSDVARRARSPPGEYSGSTCWTAMSANKISLISTRSPSLSPSTG